MSPIFALTALRAFFFEVIKTKCPPYHDSERPSDRQPDHPQERHAGALDGFNGNFRVPFLPVDNLYTPWVETEIFAGPKRSRCLAKTCASR